MNSTHVLEVAVQRLITYVEREAIYVRVPEGCTDTDVEQFIKSNEHLRPWRFIARPVSYDCPGELVDVEVLEIVERQLDADETVFVLERGEDGELQFVKPGKE